MEFSKIFTMIKNKTKTLTKREQFILELRKAGKSYNAIGQMCNPPITGSRVEQIVIRIGGIRGRIGPYYTAEDAKQYYEQTYPTQLKQVLKRWPSNGVCNMKALAEAVGLTEQVIYRIRKLYNLPYVLVSTRAKIPLEQRDVVCDAYVNGEGIMSLARKYSAQHNTIARTLRAKFKTMEAAKRARDANLKKRK